MGYAFAIEEADGSYADYVDFDPVSHRLLVEAGPFEELSDPYGDIRRFAPAELPALRDRVAAALVRDPDGLRSAASMALMSAEEGLRQALAAAPDAETYRRELARVSALRERTDAPAEPAERLEWHGRLRACLEGLRALVDAAIRRGRPLVTLPD